MTLPQVFIRNERVVMLATRLPREANDTKHSAKVANPQHEGGR
ncbi:hypothetical protein [Qipengyuania sp. MTN3-11]